MSQEIFQSSVPTDAGIAGVFEYDGEVAYFYLYDLRRAKGKQVAASLRVFSGNIKLAESDFEIKWNKGRSYLGLFIQGVLWAAYDLRGNSVGGNFVPGSSPNISAFITQSF